MWRIEKFKVVAVPAENVGSFYEGDSYIVLRTRFKGIDQQKKKLFNWDIHFWLGAKTSQDEAGTAAYKTVELDDVLGGAAVQHREVTGHESHQFVSYFADRGGMMILQGGIESGFRIVQAQEFKPRLLWVKGRRNVRVAQVPISAESLNADDVFVLDIGLELFQWQGSESAAAERLRAALLCRAICDERAGKPIVHVDERDSQHNENQLPRFWRLLGYEDGLKRQVKSGDGIAGDMEWERIEDGLLKLFRRSDTTGELRFTLEAQGRRVTEDKLDKDDVFILDSGPEIFVWIGRDATRQERDGGMDAARSYMAGAGRPAFLPVTRILDGGENETFKSFFQHQ